MAGERRLDESRCCLLLSHSQFRPALVSAFCGCRRAQARGLVQSPRCHAALQEAHDALGFSSAGSVDAAVAVAALTVHGRLPEDRPELTGAISSLLDGGDLSDALCREVRVAVLREATSIGPQSWELTKRVVSQLPAEEGNVADFTANYTEACRRAGSIIGAHIIESASFGQGQGAATDFA